MLKLPDLPLTKQAVFFDVDDTLVEWVQPTDPHAEKALIVDTILVRPITTHVNALRAHKARGDQIVVWSQGGSDWCENVVRALGLEDCVDLVMSKPRTMYDDLLPSQWGINFIYSPTEPVSLPEQFEFAED